MPDRVRGNAYRTTLVCVDESREGEFSGRIYNPYWSEGVTFRGVIGFLTQMEDLLDQMNLPQSFTAKRSFSSPPGTHERTQPMLERRTGRRATFAVRVLFRQNATWQGSVTWMEKNQEESFRSVLELLLLMNSAMEKQEQGCPKTGTCFSALHSKTEGDL